MIKKQNNVYYPNTYEEAKELSSILKREHKLIINHSLLNDENRKRLIDFLIGTTFALEGQTKKISKNKLMFETNTGGTDDIYSFAR